MMGSKRRARIVKERLMGEGFERDAVMGVRSPIGLSIGARTPEEIAVSIMGEIIEVKNGKENAVFPQELLGDILALPHEPSLPGRKALCTIVSKTGSAPRGVGTKMLCTSEGRSLGSIGGGCTEAGVVARAREMFLEENPAPVLMRVELTAEEAAEEGEVCGGVIEVWIEEIK